MILRLPPKMLIKFRLGRVARAARRARHEALERKAARDRAAALIDDQNYLRQVFISSLSQQTAMWCARACFCLCTCVNFSPLYQQ